MTDASGTVTFSTMYPGWYSGRTTHIHVKVHVGASTAVTSQLYFPDDVTNAAYTQAPYAARGQRDTTNGTDGILGSVDESAVLLDVTLQNGTYVAELTLGIASTGSTTTTTTPSSNSTTTTTTVPASACTGTTGFVTARCHTTELRAAVMAAVGEGMVRRRLVRALDRRVAARVARADTLASGGGTRRARKQLARALGGLNGFRQALASRTASQAIGADVRASLEGSAQVLAAELAALRQGLA